MSSLRVALGRTVRRLRVAAAQSQQTFADRCGVHRTLISAIEQGRANICLSTVEKLANGFAITTSELLRKAERADNE